MFRGMERLLFTILAAFALCTSAASADSFRLRLEDVDGGKGVVVTDNGSGDINPIVGAITYLGSISDDFFVNVTTGLSQPVIGGINNYAELDLNSINVQVGHAGTLRITLEDSGYTSGPDGALAAIGLVGGTLTAAHGSTATFQSWVNPFNLVPDLGPDAYLPSELPAIAAIPGGSVAMWSEGGVTFGPGAFSDIASEDFIRSGAYALFTQATIDFTGPGMVSFDTNISAVPEPTSLLLIGSGLAGMGLWVRKKKKTTQL